MQDVELASRLGHRGVAVVGIAASCPGCGWESVQPPDVPPDHAQRLAVDEAVHHVLGSARVFREEAAKAGLTIEQALFRRRVGL